MKIAFDIDGTLQNSENQKNELIHELLKKFQSLGAEIYVWSGGGIDYAKRYIEKNNINAKIVTKGSITVDLAIDDVSTTRLGNVTLIYHEIY